MKTDKTEEEIKQEKKTLDEVVRKLLESAKETIRKSGFVFSRRV